MPAQKVTRLVAMHPRLGLTVAFLVVMLLAMGDPVAAASGGGVELSGSLRPSLAPDPTGGMPNSAYVDGGP